jgi:glycosyltransferase involved in cell wall biosynthesis
MSGLVSVIIPCYNAAETLQQTIDSVTAQPGCKTEIIVINDGSTDGSRKLLDEMGSSVRVEHCPNQGVSAARERGVQLSRGEFLLFLDADDLLVPDTLSCRIEALATSEADVVYSGWQRLEKSSDGWRPTTEIRRRYEEVHPEAEIAFFTEMWAPTAAYLWRRTFLESRHPGWHPKLPVIQDARFAWDAAHAGAQILYYDSISVLYRTHQSNSVSTRSRRAFLKDCCENAIEIETMWRAKGRLTPAQTQALIGVWGNFTRNTYSVDQDLFQDCWRRLKTLDPHYIPSGGKGFRTLAGLVGYPLAEGVAHFSRRLLRKSAI